MMVALTSTKSRRESLTFHSSAITPTGVLAGATGAQQVEYRTIVHNQPTAVRKKKKKRGTTHTNSRATACHTARHTAAVLRSSAAQPPPPPPLLAKTSSFQRCAPFDQHRDPPRLVTDLSPFCSSLAAFFPCCSSPRSNAPRLHPPLRLLLLPSSF